MSGLKIGNQDAVHLRFSYPEPKPEGDALWSWYKYAPDAGGYYVRGLLLVIITVGFTGGLGI
jgi:hypothetical protein